MKRLLTVAAILVALVLPAAADAAPEWSVESEHGPTPMPACGVATVCGEYVVFPRNLALNESASPATNAAEPPYALTDRLPTGVRALSVHGKGWLCSLAALGTVVNCRGTETVYARSANPALSGGSLNARRGFAGTIFIDVAVAPGTVGTGYNHVELSGGGAAEAAFASEPTAFDAGPAAFGLTAFAADAFDGPSMGAQPVRQAGAHPFEARFRLDLNLKMTEDAELGRFTQPAAPLRTALSDLPPGFIGNPEATVKCSPALFKVLDSGGSGPICPPDSQVGTVDVMLNNVAGIFGTDQQPNGSHDRPLYALRPPRGAAALLGFTINTVANYLIVRLVPSGDPVNPYMVRAIAENVPKEIPVRSALYTLWGVPGDAAHDPLRFHPGTGATGATQADSYYDTSYQGPVKPFLSLPTRCSSPGSTTYDLESWPGAKVTATTPPVTQTGCENLRFEPTIEAAPTTDRADAPSGLDVRLHVPQDEDPEGLATPQPKDVRLTLPEGLVVNPASADGLAACSMAEIGFEQDGAPNGEPVACPEASKLGTVTATTPLLAEKLHGAAYLAAQDANPFHSLLALYLTLEDRERGVLVKLAGEVEPDPRTGRLTTVFRNNPQLPVEDLEVSLKQGARAPLRTPRSCGAHAVTSTITPWSAPATPDATPSSSFQIAAAPGGGACQAPDSSPSFAAGTEAPAAGRYSPFDLHLARADGSQELSRIETTLPTGLLARLGGVAECTDAQLAAAMANGGRAEQAQPSCPASARIGTVDVAAGAGPAPLRVTGTAYLAGPYKGAPLSLAVVTPAVAGPFDLGTVVVRAALDVDLTTAQVRALSDPIPTVVKGISLDVRSIDLHLDRSRFTLNPTSCDPTQVASTVTSVSGASAHPASRFQVGGCGALRFKPKLKLQLKGATKRSGHPALKAVLTYPKRGRYANISRAQVGLPHSEFLDQGNLNKVCKQADLHAGTCPKSSIYGHAKAWTPLLDKPLEGPVYLGVGFGYKLPALVADLNGRIRILLVGRVDTTKRHGVRSTFEVVPDAPVSRFVLTMKGGKRYGLLENSENTCRSTQRASALLTAQNGDRLHLRPKIANGCGGKHRRASHARRRAAGSSGAHASSTFRPGPAPQGGPAAIEGPVAAAPAATAFGPVTVASTTAGGCPNEAVRVEQHATHQPACRAYELVGPAEKNVSNYVMASPSSDGARVAYQLSNASDRIARAEREALPDGLGRWRQEDLMPPQRDQGANTYGLFTATPDRRLVFFAASYGGIFPRPAPPMTLGRLDGGGAQTIFGTLSNTEQGQGEQDLLVSDDGAHAFMRSVHPFDSEHPPGGISEVYDLAAGPLLVSRLPGGGVPLCGASFADSTHGSTELTHWNSVDGRYVFFLSRGSGDCGTDPLELYRRDIAAETTSLVSGPALSGDSDATFLRASADGSEAVYVTAAKLAPEDENGDPDIYLWQAGSGNSCLTCVVADAGVEQRPGEPAANIGRAVGVSGDLSRAYFVSSLDLAPGGQAGEASVYLLQGGEIDYVAPAAGVFALVDSPQLGAAINPDGSVIVFSSDNPALDSRTDPSSDNAGLRQYYRYDAMAKQLTCVSCPAARPASTAVNTAGKMAGGGGVEAYPHVLSDDGSRFFFETEDALVAADENGADDIYEWHDGTFGLITDGLSDNGTLGQTISLVGGSVDGTDVFFTAFSPYTASAGDGAMNLFDARIGGGEPGTVAPARCEGEACQPPATPAPPVAAAPATETFTSPGNPHRRRSCGKGKRKVRRGGKVRCVRRHAGHKHHRGHRRHRPHRGKRKG